MCVRPLLDGLLPGRPVGSVRCLRIAASVRGSGAPVSAIFVVKPVLRSTFYRFSNPSDPGVPVPVPMKTRTLSADMGFWRVRVVWVAPSELPEGYP